MNGNDIKTYKKFARFVSASIPLLAQNAKIIGALKAVAGDIEAKTIKEALHWGKGPTIELRQYARDPKAGTIATGGYKANSNKLTVNTYYVSQYEVGHGEEKRRTANGTMVNFVEVILLHELAHWADEQDGKVNDAVDVGFEFEKRVYGGQVTSEIT